MRLGLGTAQFGMDYGVSNTVGKASIQDISGILDLAHESGVSLLDTAPHYGDSEEVLGLFRVSDRFKVVTKVSSMADLSASEKAAHFKDGLTRSLSRLGVDSVYAVLMHDSRDLLGPCGGEIAAEARECQDAGMIGGFGVSVYDPEEAEKVLDRFPVDIVQLPANVFDQRFVSSGLLSTLRDDGIEVHLRSVFLQGVLLMPPENLPAHLRGLHVALEAFRSACSRIGITPAQGALAHIRKLEGMDCAIVGVTTLEQFASNLRDYEAAGNCNMDFGPFAVHNQELVDPRRWAPRQGADR